MIYLIIYDIGSDKSRAKIARALEAEGYERLQYSVFTGTANPEANATLWQKLKKYCNEHIDEYNNQLVVIKTSKENFANLTVIGEETIDIDYLMGKQHTMII